VATVTETPVWFDHVQEMVEGAAILKADIFWLLHDDETDFVATATTIESRDKLLRVLREVVSRLEDGSWEKNRSEVLL
jgi:hypothetical protein